MHTLLLIDDDQDILITNKLYFERNDYQVFCAENTEEALNHVMKNSVDCIILDILLDKEDGLLLCKMLKRVSKTPIIFLTSLSDEDTLAKAFSSGGDDYMSKPYRLKELNIRIMARIQASNQNSKQTILTFGVLQINYATRQVSINQTLIKLTNFEYEILWLLSSSPGKVFTFHEIYHMIWNESAFESAQTVQVHIAHLRKKMDIAYPRHHFIETVWGEGYMFSKPSVMK